MDLIKDGKILKGLAIGGGYIENGSSPSGGGVVPRNVKNIQVQINPTSIGLRWQDPDDTLDHEGNTYCKWAGTKVVYREGNEYPLNENDGILAINSTTKNEYQNKYLIVEPLISGTTYSFSLFPYSSDNSYNTNELNSLTLTPTVVVDFATATDDQIAAMLEAHYKGLIDIADYWHVGDKRRILTNRYEDLENGYIFPAQYIDLVILDFNHDELVSPIGKRTNSAISIGVINFLYEDEINGSPLTYRLTEPKIGELPYPSKYYSDYIEYANNIIMPEKINSLMKDVYKLCLTDYDDPVSEKVSFKKFLYSYTELMGLEPYTYYVSGLEPLYNGKAVEGEQYEYFKTPANRIMYDGSLPENPSQDAYGYYLRSLCSRTYILLMKTNGNVGRTTFSKAKACIVYAFCI